MSDPHWPTVLFDFDGTLANTIPLIVASYRHTIERFGLDPADDITIRSWIGRTLPDMFGELVGDEREPELTDAYSAWQQEHVEELLEPFAGIDELLVDLRAAGVRMGVATSRRRPSAERLAAALDLHTHLPVLVTMEDTPVHKPNPAPLLLAAERIGAEPADCVYVGDATVDLGAADAAGMAGIGVTWGAGLSEELRALPSVAVVDTVDELRRLLLPSV
ncbi:HAD family hydrolase [Aestuariimicrobium ganziense]|uniref:HAD family hydrolase n=1 Tax=Aestuariimicrobium ganziense TaxID=2773677 RepID=UPI001941C4EB|nr:HAD family hydrolase [Aestuariimicrobium ganziense]